MTICIPDSPVFGGSLYKHTLLVLAKKESWHTHTSSWHCGSTILMLALSMTFKKNCQCQHCQCRSTTYAWYCTILCMFLNAWSRVSSISPEKGGPTRLSIVIFINFSVWWPKIQKKIHFINVQKNCSKLSKVAEFVICQGLTSLQTHNILIPYLEGAFLFTTRSIQYEFTAKFCTVTIRKPDSPVFKWSFSRHNLCLLIKW
jgi:hypothetical protein